MQLRRISCGARVGTETNELALVRARWPPDVRSAQIMTRRGYQGSSRLKWVFVGVAESMRIGSPATSTNDARSTNKARVCEPFTLHVTLGFTGT